MRKCTSCDYLLFGDGDTCNHCGTPLPVVAAVAAAPAPAGPAPAAPDPLPGAGWRASLPSTPPPPLALPPGASAPVTADFFRPPTPTAPPARKSRSGTALMLVVLLVLGAGAYKFYTSQRDKLPAGASDYVAGEGVEFTASDRSYSVRLPIKPQVTEQPFTVQNATVTLNAALVSQDEYELGAASVTLPMNVPAAQVDQVLESSLDGGISNVDGELVSKKLFERGGVPAIDAKFKAPDGYSAHIVVMVDGARLYMLFSHAKHGTDRLFKTLDESFVPAIG
jgi:hypothetical protein